MKNKLLKITAIFVLLLLIIGYACREELQNSIEDNNETPAIESVKAWYESNKPEEMSLRSSNGKEKMAMSPVWENSYTMQDKKYKMVETNLMSYGRIAFFDENCVKKYEETQNPYYRQCYTHLVFRINKSTKDTVAFLMTIVPDVEYLEKSDFKPFLESSYLYRPKQFGGTILYHNLDGSFSNGWRYENGKIAASISSLNTDSATFELRSTVCHPVTYVVSVENCVDMYIGTEVGGVDTFVKNGTHCWTTYTTQTGQECYDDGTSSSNPGGVPDPTQTSSGSGTPTTPTTPPTTPPKKAPCTSAAGDKANPVDKMKLAPPVTDGNANIAGATYGYTRTERGKPKFHDGIDLAGAVGTPIYAQFDGTIASYPLAPVSSQPNRTNGVLPSTYKGDNNKAGNRITINSTVGGKTVSNSYWHLQAGTPIANNPRTGNPWQAGDAIKAGEVIGYIGITGNANPNVPHVHVNTLVNGASADPKNYLNATVSKTTATITTPCD